MKHLVKSVPNKGKIKNGDNFNYHEDDEVIIAIVADGVGGNACDWKASEQACEDLVYFYQQESTDISIKDRVGTSLMKTYARIYWTKGECESMLTTMVAVIVDKKNNQYYYFGIGDSMILKFEDNTIEEITPETAFRIQPQLLPARVMDGGSLKPGTSFALMSDGFSENRKNYKYELRLVVEAEEWENKFDQLFQLNLLTQYDDTTLMVLRN